VLILLRANANVIISDLLAPDPSLVISDAVVPFVVAPWWPDDVPIFADLDPDSLPFRFSLVDPALTGDVGLALVTIFQDSPLTTSRMFFLTLLFDRAAS